MLVPLMASAENYLVDGARCVYQGIRIDTEEYLHGFCIDGTETALGQVCLRFCDLYGNLLTLIRTEDEKVYFLHHPSDTEWSLLYDFSLQPGDRCTVTDLDYEAFANDDPEKYPRRTFDVVCLDRVRLQGYGDNDVLIMDDADCDGKNQFTVGNKWVVGFGNPAGITENARFRWIGAPKIDNDVLNFSIGDKTLYRSFDIDGSTAFVPHGVWQMACGDGLTRYAWLTGYMRSGKFFCTLYTTVDDAVQDAYGNTHYSRSCAEICIDGDQVYRVTGYAPLEEDLPKELAYDFAIQPGDVRSIVSVDSERGDDPTWVRCRKRSASEVFPGRDEIWLDEFADEALTERIGGGLWISGIGSPFSVLYNNRFADIPVESNLTDVSAVGEQLWSRTEGAPDYSGIEAIGAAAAGAACCPAAYYNMQGIRIGGEPTAPGVYIRVSDSGEISKILLR